jgi:hypothetical protein
MSNPYKPPTDETRERSARPWMILSAILFIGVILLGVIVLRSARQAEEAKVQAQLARERAVITSLKAQGEMMHQKEGEAGLLDR